MLRSTPTGRVLDIGCGFGNDLRRLKDEGWQTYGIDINPIAARYARKLGLKVFTGQLREAKFPDNFLMQS